MVRVGGWWQTVVNEALWTQGGPRRHTRRQSHNLRHQTQLTAVVVPQYHNY